MNTVETMAVNNEGTVRGTPALRHKGRPPVLVRLPEFLSLENAPSAAPEEQLRPEPLPHPELGDAAVQQPVDVGQELQPQRLSSGVDGLRRFAVQLGGTLVGVLALVAIVLAFRGGATEDMQESPAMNWPELADTQATEPVPVVEAPPSAPHTQAVTPTADKTESNSPMDTAVAAAVDVVPPTGHDKTAETSAAQPATAGEQKSFTTLEASHQRAPEMLTSSPSFGSMSDEQPLPPVDTVSAGAPQSPALQRDRQVTYNVPSHDNAAGLEASPSGQHQTQPLPGNRQATEDSSQQTIRRVADNRQEIRHPYDNISDARFTTERGAVPLMDQGRGERTGDNHPSELTRTDAAGESASPPYPSTGFPAHDFSVFLSRPNSDTYRTARRPAP